MNLLVNVVNVFVDDDGAHGNPLGIVWASRSTRKREQQIAADLGFSETIFIDAVAEPAGKVRARMFAADLGIREDEATGSAAVALSAQLGRDLEIRQGEGSLLRTHVRYLGQQIEVGGRVSEARITELR